MRQMHAFIRRKPHSHSDCQTKLAIFSSRVRTGTKQGRVTPGQNELFTSGPSKRPRVSLNWLIPDPAPLHVELGRHFRDSGNAPTAEAAVPAPAPEPRPWFPQTESPKSSWISGGISARSFSLSLGSSTVRIPTRCAASSFSLTPPMGSTLPRRVISPVMAKSQRTGICVRALTMAVQMVMPAEGPSLGMAPSGTCT